MRRRVLLQRMIPSECKLIVFSSGAKVCLEQIYLNALPSQFLGGIYSADKCDHLSRSVDCWAHIFAKLDV